MSDLTHDYKNTNNDLSLRNMIIKDETYNPNNINTNYDYSNSNNRILSPKSSQDHGQGQKDNNNYTNLNNLNNQNNQNTLYSPSSYISNNNYSNNHPISNRSKISDKPSHSKYQSQSSVSNYIHNSQPSVGFQNQMNQLQREVEALKLIEKKYIELLNKFEKISTQTESLKIDKDLLEKENKFQADMQKKAMYDLKSEINNLNYSLHEKINQNKLLFNDYTTLQIEIDNKNHELTKLKNQIINYSQANKNLVEEKAYLEKTLSDLREIKSQNKARIDELLKSNESISQKCFQQEEEIKKLEKERDQLVSLNEELDNENKIIISKLRNFEKNSSDAMEKLNTSNKENENIEKQYKELNEQNNLLQKQIEDVSQNSKIEIKNRIEKDRELDYIEKNVRDKEDELNNLKNEIENLKTIKEKVIEDNYKLYSSVDNLRNHLVVLSEQNEKLSKELDNILVQDQRIKCHLQRRENLSKVVSTNKSIIDKSQENLENYLITSKKNLKNYINLDNSEVNNISNLNKTVTLTNKNRFSEMNENIFDENNKSIV